MPDDTPNHQKHPEITLKKSPASDATANALIAGSYKIIREIGKGGAGTVFEVEHVFLNQRFAMKTLHGQYSEVTLRRFQQEAQVASDLVHPNLVRAYNFGLLETGEPFFIMDLVEGQTLSDLLKAEPLSTDEMCDIFIPICEALHYAHDKGLVHRDLKPGNIVITKENDKTVPKIIDFGIARLSVGGDNPLTKTGDLFGTPKYMSPEQCVGQRVDLKSDVYSLGCVIFESLTGEAPFIGENALSTMMLHQNAEALSLREASLGKIFPPALEACVSKVLAKDPDKRYQDCLELANDLHRIKNKQPHVIPELKLTNFEKAQNKKSRTIAIRIGVGLFTIALVAVFAFKTLPQTPVARISTIRPTSVVQPGPVSGATNDQESSYKFSRIEGKERVFDFGKKSIGEIEWGNSKTRTKRSAVGVLRIPVAEPVEFKTRWNVLIDTKTLRHFRKDDLIGLEVRHQPVNIFFNEEESDQSFDDALFFASGLTGIKTLLLANAPITMNGIRAMHLEDFKEIAFLNIADTKIDLREFSKTAIIPRLERLTIAKMPHARSVLAVLAKQPNCRLRFLDMELCNLNDQDLSYFSKIPVRSLILTSNPKITDLGIKALINAPELNYIRIDRCNKLTAKCFQSIRAMANKKLEQVQMATDQFPGFEVQRLEQQLPKTCRVIITQSKY